MTSNVLPIAAFIEQAGGSLDAALALVEELEGATRDGPACYRADPLPLVARICRAADQPELAERFLAGADAPAARYRHCLATAHAVLAETKGDLEVAVDRYTAAAEGWRNFGVVLEQGQALLGAGRCATRLGGAGPAGPGAGAALSRARAIFESLGATTLAAETDRLLAEG